MEMTSGVLGIGAFERKLDNKVFVTEFNVHISPPETEALVSKLEGETGPMLLRQEGSMDDNQIVGLLAVLISLEPRLPIQTVKGPLVAKGGCFLSSGHEIIHD